MSKLTLYRPTSPFQITQAWGISNPSYLQFGFSKHNGVDFAISPTKRVKCPVRSKIVDTGFNSGAGNFARLVTTEKYDIGDANCYAGSMWMHFERVTCKIGQILEAGDEIGVPDNTGFSTGPHTHVSFYRLKEPENVPQNRLDLDPATNYTFDPLPYMEGLPFIRDLHLGSTGEDVQRLQKWLNAHLYPVTTPGYETNFYGPKTVNAVASLQRAVGLYPALGYFGPKTRGLVNGSG